MDLVDITEKLCEPMGFLQWIELDGSEFVSLDWTSAGPDLGDPMHRAERAHVLFLGSPDKVPPVCPPLWNGRGGSNPASLPGRPQVPNKKMGTGPIDFSFQELGNWGSERYVNLSELSSSKRWL